MEETVVASLIELFNASLCERFKCDETRGDVFNSSPRTADPYPPPPIPSQATTLMVGYFFSSFFSSAEVGRTVFKTHVRYIHLLTWHPCRTRSKNFL